MDLAETLSRVKLQYKEAGNESFKTANYALAVKNYSAGLQNDPNDIHILSNRSMAYLRQGLYTPALSDAERVLSIHPSHSKCIYRKVKALWGLWKYGEAVSFISSLNDPNFTDLSLQADKMLSQSRGWYDPVELKSLADLQTHEIGEYQGPLKIVQIPGKGRGYVATSTISPGEIIQLSKAFAITFSSESKEGCVIDEHSRQALIQGICEKLSQDPSLRSEFAQLCSTPASKNPNWVWEDSEDPVIERQMVAEVHSRLINNSFASDDPNFTGLWILASYFNHDCIDANTHWKFYGDVMCIRALRKISPGEEVTIYYKAADDPDRVKDLKDAQQFTCNCRLCLFERHEPPATKTVIDSTLEAIRQDLKAAEPDLDGLIAKVKLLQDLRGEENKTLNMALLDDSVEQVILRLYGDMRFVEAVQMLKALRKVLTTACHVDALVQKDMTIISCYLQLGIRDEVKHWMKVLKQDLIKAYGGVEYFREIGTSLLEELEEFGIDFFNSD